MKESVQHHGAMGIRLAESEDAPAIAALINAAYLVEAFFKSGDRTSTGEVFEMLRKGHFLVLETDGQLGGTVYVEIEGDRGYFGMLSIAPSRQKLGLGARLVTEAENFCRDAGCSRMELHVVNLRTELPPYYRRLGYAEEGTLPFPPGETATRPCHFIVMGKQL